PLLRLREARRPDALPLRGRALAVVRRERPPRARRARRRRVSRLLVETPDVLALDKPAGVSLAPSSRPGSAEEAVRSLLAASCLAAEGDVPRLVHRLDVGTTGVVLLAKSDSAHRALSRALQQKTARKAYRALVFGHPVPARGRIDLPLARDPKDGRKMRVAPD